MTQSITNKKILIVCNSTFAYNQFLVNLVNKLNKLKNEIYLIAGKDNNNGNIEKHNLKEVFFVKMPKRKLLSFLSFFHTIRSINKIINILQPDMIISNNRDASSCTRLGMFFLKKNKIKNIYFARGFYFHDDQNYLTWILTYLIEVFLLFKTDYILSQSKQDIKKINFINSYINVPISWVGNGVNKTKFKYRKKNFNINKIQFATTCRITKGKGLDDLLFVFAELVKKFPNIKLTIIGGPVSIDDNLYYDHLKRIISQYNLTNIVNITGITNEVYKYLADSDFYLHPSYREGMPKSLIEAMSTGIIPIASNIRGSNELIINNKNGFLFPAKNKKELYNSLIKVISLSNDKFQEMSSFSYKSVEIYNEESYLDRQINGIQNIFK
tara:strand:- start:7020 stop:8168 length:1149 start_codon:yes stop_codon:yes gene_type:complete